MFKFIRNWFKNDFATKHGKIIGSFSKALNAAKKLEAEMAEKIVEKQEEIKKINSEIDTITEVKDLTSKFAQNMSKLIE